MEKGENIHRPVHVSNGQIKLAVFNRGELASVLGSVLSIAKHQGIMRETQYPRKSNKACDVTLSVVFSYAEVGTGASLGV